LKPNWASKPFFFTSPTLTEKAMLSCSLKARSMRLLKSVYQTAADSRMVGDW
jgi:hypothetical protein